MVLKKTGLLKKKVWMLIYILSLKFQKVKEYQQKNQEFTKKSNFWFPNINIKNSGVPLPEPLPKQLLQAGCDPIRKFPKNRNVRLFSETIGKPIRFPKKQAEKQTNRRFSANNIKNRLFSKHCFSQITVPKQNGKKTGRKLFFSGLFLFTEKTEACFRYGETGCLPAKVPTC